MIIDKEIDRQEWLECIIDTIPFGLVAINMEGIVCSVSDAYCELVGIPRNKIIGKPLIEMRPEAKLPMTLIDGQARRMIVRPKGMELVVEFSPIIYNNRIIGAISCGESITNWNKKNADLIEQVNTLKSQNKKIMEFKNAQYTFDSIITESPVMHELLSQAARAAKTDLPILITGESGTGKELLVQGIHNAGDKSGKPFIAINCAAIPPVLLESEIFGYEAGSFTGANKSGKSGLFEIAGDGTIFLDEIGEMPIDLQAKLLRVLQDKKYRRVGGTKEHTVNARFITATNQDLEQLIEKGRFRKDLYYRINTILLTIPPLRERTMDIPLLINYFLKFSDEHVPKKVTFIINQETLEILKTYNWPGNVRELKNAVEYAGCMATNHEIDIRCFPKILQEKSMSIRDQNIIVGKTLKEYTDDYEAKLIFKALNEFGWDLAGKHRCAEALNISIGTLYYKINKLGIKPETSI